jgi:hypothetical protein
VARVVNVVNVVNAIHAVKVVNVSTAVERRAGLGWAGLSACQVAAA